MRRIAATATVLLGALAGGGLAGGLPGFGPPRKTHPAIVALRDCTATLRTNLGELTLTLDPDAAPDAVRSFVRLAERGAYDGARVSCVFKGRMLLAGDSAAADKAAASRKVAFEESPLSATAGAVAFDRAPDGGNLCDRLLILVSDQPHLDRDYTVFAELTKGLDVAKRIAAVATRPNDGSPAPLEDVVIEEVIVSKKTPSASKETKN